MQTFARLPRNTLEVADGPIAAVPDDRLRGLAHYWAARCINGRVPLRTSIDPLDLPALLPNIMLLERVEEAETDRYRFRLAGTDIARYTGRELTGQFIDQVLPDSYHDYVRLLNRVALARQRPVYSSSLYHDEGNFVNGITYRLVLPLRSGDTPPDMILACQYWQRRADDGAWIGDWRRVKPEIRVLAE
jgi:hypothetical protein